MRQEPPSVASTNRPQFQMRLLRDFVPSATLPPPTASCLPTTDTPLSFPHQVKLSPTSHTTQLRLEFSLPVKGKIAGLSCPSCGLTGMRHAVLQRHAWLRTASITTMLASKSRLSTVLIISPFASTIRRCNIMSFSKCGTLSTRTETPSCRSSMRLVRRISSSRESECACVTHSQRLQADYCSSSFQIMSIVQSAVYGDAWTDLTFVGDT